jgi:hypothetical protein
LWSYGPFEAEDAAHAAELRKLLTIPPPAVYVVEAEPRVRAQESAPEILEAAA